MFGKKKTQQINDSEVGLKEQAKDYLQEENIHIPKEEDIYGTEGPTLYPFGAPSYSAEAPETDSQYLWKHDLKCPVCGKDITVMKPLTARLGLQKIDKDLRRHYHEFEPIWYDIWCCPNCYYSALYTKFEESRSFEAARIREGMVSFKEAVDLTFSTPRKVNEAITSMYMALYCGQFYDCESVVKAKIYMHLSWIYNDLGDQELYMKASARALEYYKLMYYETREDFEPIVEQTCFLVMAELNILHKNYEEAYNCLIHSRQVEGGNRLYKLDAQNRIEDVKEMRAMEKENK